MADHSFAKNREYLVTMPHLPGSDWRWRVISSRSGRQRRMMLAGGLEVSNLVVVATVIFQRQALDIDEPV